jgi:hypothetical protein
MEEFVRTWLFNPAVGKVATAANGIFVILFLMRILKKSVARYIRNTKTRYRAGTSSMSESVGPP